MNDPSHIPNKTIEEEAAQLVQAFEKELGTRINPPIPVFEIIEFLGYNLDFRSDGFYEDPNNLGGLHIDEKLVVINENLAEQEGRMHFTAAHEIGHIKLHVPILMEQRARENILCRKDEGFEGTKKDPLEWQADTFAAYLLMPRDMVNDAFKKVSYHPITLKKKRFLISIPFAAAKLQSYFLQMLPNPLLTSDQVEMLKYNNIVSGNHLTLKDLGIVGTTIQSILPKYIYRFRTGGQFG